MDSYHHLVSEYERLLREGRAFQLGGFPPAPRPSTNLNAPKALFFAPHPDDECIIGGLALRLLREAGMNVINVAVTQGARKERQIERFKELEVACNYLGFGLIPTGPHGLERIHPKTRAQDPAFWETAVQVIARILTEHQPRMILF